MSELGPDLKDTLTRLFSEQVDRHFLHRQEEFGWQPPLWSFIEELGITLAMVPEDQGGVGCDWDDAYEVIKAIGQYAVPLPVGETLIARWLLSLANWPQPKGPGTLIQYADMKRVPWGRDVSWGLAQDPDSGNISLLSWGPGEVIKDQNLAGEPRDFLIKDKLSKEIIDTDLPADTLINLGAILRAAQISGAALALVLRTSQYASERRQFGRTLDKFQSVQHNLARLASAAASIDSVTRTSYRKLNLGLPRNEYIDSTRLSIAAAKFRASEAADLIAGVAHQIHGAIGFSHEHDLHFFTRRLWSWRTEFGSASYWLEILGEAVRIQGGYGVWKTITANTLTDN